MAVKPVTDVTFTFATDVNFSSGPASGNPTKVNPPGWTAVTQGNVPGNAIVAEFDNKIKNIMGQWTGWLAAGSSAGAADAHIVEADTDGDAAVQGLYAQRVMPLQLLNFTEANIGLGATGEIWDCNYHPDFGYYYAAVDDTANEHILVSPNGLSWNTLPVTSAPTGAFPCIGLDDSVILAPSPSSAEVFRATSVFGTLAAVTCTNLLSGEDILYEPVADRWVIVGEDSSNDPGIWTSDDSGATWTQRTVPNAAAYAGGLTSVAFGASIYVACGTNADTYWTSPDGTTWTERTELTLTDALASVTFNEQLALFLMSSVEGVAGDVISSSNGTSWTSTTGAIPGAPETTVQDLVSVGTYFIAHVPSEAQTFDPDGLGDDAGGLFVSADSGVTWDKVLPYTYETGFHSEAVVHQLRATPGGRRLIAWGTNSTDGGLVAMSLLPQPEM